MYSAYQQQQQQLPQSYGGGGGGGASGGYAIQSQPQRGGRGGDVQGGQPSPNMLNGIAPPQSQHSTSPQGPLDKKIMVLYLVPGEPVSMQAWQMVVDYPEVLVQDARQIQPKPQWLQGVPTVVMVNNKAIYEGPQAFQVLSSYVQNMKAMSGAQNEMVVPTLGLNQGFAVASKEHHHKACADEKRTAAVPLGTGSHTAMSVGQLNFATEDDPRYYQTGKINESEVEQYKTLRSQVRPRSVKWNQSVLENGEMVTM